jgi:ADP-ribosyl-[dinitrogen reductase] hydrolase
MLVDRFLGSLVGVAVGDALGGPADGLEAETIRERYGSIEGYRDAQPDQPQRWRQPGLHSDDTQQALIVTDSALSTNLSSGVAHTMYPSDHYPVLAVLRLPAAPEA